MATSVRQYSIKFKNLKDGQISCTDPVIKLLNVSDNIVQKCVFDNKTKSVVFSVYEDAIEGLQGTCINFSVLCESCGKCEPVNGKLCFCNNFTDCDPCQDCINGTCVNRCPNMLCVNDKCVNCADNNDCKNNLICVNGKCQCPPGLPYYDEVAEKCYGCQNDNECGPCHVCVDGNCEKLDCICDEDLNKCVECVKSSDCPLPNQICKNNKCVCAPGFIWDPVLEECVVAPPCSDDDDCEDPCKICVNGNCEDIICPDPNQVCIDGNCVDIPCEGPCDDATDCGPNCGCLNGVCVDCASLTCEECAQTIGCKCVNGKCKKDTSPCSQYSCDTNCGERPDCECQPDGSCEEKECEGDSTLSKNDDECKLEYELETTSCCACSPMTIDNKFLGASIIGDVIRINSSVEVRKGSVNSPFDIINLHRVDQEQFDDIMSNEEATEGQIRVTAKYTYEGITNGFPNGNITTETVTLGSIYDVAGVGFRTALFTMNIPGRQYPTGLRVLRSALVTYTLVSELAFESGCVYNQGTVIGTYFFNEGLTENALKNDINTFTPGQDSNANYWIAKTLNSTTACRNPEARWFKAKANSSGGITAFDDVPFRKQYLTKLTPTTYSDFISQPDEHVTPDNHGELFSGYYYKVATDCACTNEATAYYESTCANPGRLVFCDPETANITFDPCGKKFMFASSFITNCLPNYDYYGANSSFVPDDAKLRYSIFVNGSSTPLSGSTRIADINGLIYNVGQQFTANELIRYIEIKLSHDNCDECTIRVNSDVDLELPSYNVICEPAGSNNTTFTITFTGWTNITSVTVNGNTATAGSPTIAVTVATGTTSLTGAVAVTGCPGTLPMSIQLPENCCDDLGVLLTQDFTDCNAANYAFTAVVSPNIPGTYAFSVNGVFQSSNSTGLFTTPKNIGGNEPNIVSVIFDPTASGCENVTHSIQVDKTTALVINSDSPDDIVNCGNGDITITYATTGYTGTVNYTVTGESPVAEVLDGLTDLVITVSGVVNDTKFVTITGDSLSDSLGNTCVTLNPLITKMRWVSEPNVTSISITPTEACEGDAVQFTVNGTGATATINSSNFIGAMPTTVNIGQQYTAYVGSSTNDAIITATAAHAGNCTVVVNVGAQVNVLDDPEITDFEHECETPGNPNSNISVTVFGTAGAAVTVIADEGNVVLTESPSGEYTGVIDSSNGGDSVTVNIVLGSCSTSAVYPIVSCGCDEDAVVEIKKAGTPINSDSGCVGTMPTYTSTVTGGNSPFQYEWILDNVTVLGTSSSLSTWAFVSGVHTIKLKVTDDEGCIYSKTITVTGNPLPTATVNGPTAPCVDAPNIYTVSHTNGPISTYQWFVDGSPTATTATFTYTPVDEDPHEITVQVVNSNGCQSAVSAPKVVTAIDCCVICSTADAYVRESIAFNRMKDVNNNVYTISPAVTFECVDPGDPSAANDTAATNLQTFFENLPGQCGTPIVSWASVNSGDATECLSETFNATTGTAGIWFRGIHVNGTDYLTNTKIVNATSGSITGYTVSRASAEASIESFIAFALSQADLGSLSINCFLPASVSGSTVEVKIEIVGIDAGETVRFLYAGTTGGSPTSVDINDAVCTALLGTSYQGNCIKITVDDSSIAPSTIYVSGDLDPGNTSAFIGPCNPV